MNKSNWVGVDTHQDTLACYQNGKFKEFKTTIKGFQKALEWAGKDATWAIEGAYCFGKPFSSYLLENGCQVFEVNPILTKQARKALSVCGQKNDYGDAKVISLFANSNNLQPVSLATIELKERLTARSLLVKQRAEIINSIKNLYALRGKKIEFNRLNSIKSQKWLLNQNDIIIKNFAEILLKLSESIKALEKEIEKLIPQKAMKLTKLTGISTIRAAIIYTELKGKISTKAAMANYAGLAPVENSSGKKVKHRNNRAGNRILNSVFYQISLNQSIYDPIGKSYYEKKLKEGKSKRHARKCLSRQLVNLVWKILKD
ncbi:MAG: IS110 family transposase [Ignavibacteriales bacterium]|nr:IS110 family transposase [Ignavibacteriales bacterium]